jgi:hypothetical protein
MKPTAARQGGATKRCDASRRKDDRFNLFGALVPGARSSCVVRADPSRLASFLLRYRATACVFVAPRHPGASTGSPHELRAPGTRRAALLSWLGAPLCSCEEEPSMETHFEMTMEIVLTTSREVLGELLGTA